MPADTIDGVLLLWWEQGMDSVVPAVQDHRFIERIRAAEGVRADDVWDAGAPERHGRVGAGAEILREGRWAPAADPILTDPDYRRSSRYRGAVRGDRGADRRLMRRYGFTVVWAHRNHDGGRPPSLQ